MGGRTARQPRTTGCRICSRYRIGILGSAPFDTARLLDFDLDAAEEHAFALALARGIGVRFADANSAVGAGIGGTASYIEVVSDLGFFDEAAQFQIFVQPLFIALPDQNNLEYPSLLGMDFLSAVDVHLNYSQRIVELEFVEPV